MSIDPRAAPLPGEFAAVLPSRRVPAVMLSHGLLLVGLAGQTPAPEVVHAVAPGPSNRRELERILSACGWRDTSVVAHARFVLVVVRSSATHPLASGYDSLKWLRDDAASLPRHGAQYHVYSYLARAGQRYEEATHRAYDVVEDDPFADSTRRALAVVNTRANCPSR